MMDRCSFVANFNPRPPRGGRQGSFNAQPTAPRFQSTPSARRATAVPVSARHLHMDFNPRPPRGGRQNPLDVLHYYPLFQSTPSARRATVRQKASQFQCWISIHALREEGDLVVFVDVRWPPYFNPRPPRGGRQVDALCLTRCYVISIHALREEGDPCRCKTRRFLRYFNPRPPRGGRPKTRKATHTLKVFQSTPSARRATIYNEWFRDENLISIHALREEGDQS